MITVNVVFLDTNATVQRNLAHGTATGVVDLTPANSVRNATLAIRRPRPPPEMRKPRALR